MSTEIDQTEDVIIAAVKVAASALKIVEAWPDGKNLDELLEETLSTPACYVIMRSWNPGEKKLIGGNSNEQEMAFGLAVITESQHSHKAGARAAYGYITSIMAALKGLKLTTLRGHLWPTAPVELLLVKNGYYAYGMEFTRRFNN
jgi:hypothetical protein